MSGTRAGKDGVYVYAAGNGFMQPEDLDTGDQFAGGAANAAGLSCVLASTDPAANFRQTLAVASVNARGTRSYFSSAASSVWVSAPGGEGGRQRSVAGRGQRAVAMAMARSFKTLPPLQDSGWTAPAPRRQPRCVYGWTLTWPSSPCGSAWPPPMLSRARSRPR